MHALNTWLNWCSAGDEHRWVLSRILQPESKYTQHPLTLAHFPTSPIIFVLVVHCPFGSSKFFGGVLCLLMSVHKSSQKLVILLFDFIVIDNGLNMILEPNGLSTSTHKPNVLYRMAALSFAVTRMWSEKNYSTVYCKSSCETIACTFQTKMNWTGEIENLLCTLYVASIRM